MALRSKTKTIDPAPVPADITHDLEQQRRRLAYDERRLNWMHRVTVDERTALSGADRATAKTLRGLYQQARDAFPEDMPADWQPTQAPVEALSLSDAIALNGGSRHVERTAKPGDPDPEKPGELVPPDQSRTTLVELAVIHAQGLIGIARGELEPPAPPPSQHVQPYRVSAVALSAARAVLEDEGASKQAKAAAKATIDQGARERHNFARAAMGMRPGLFTGEGPVKTGGQYDARAYGALGQQLPDAEDGGGIY
jgi:hypothetical protein